MSGYLLRLYCHPNLYVDKIGDVCPICGETELFVDRSSVDRFMGLDLGGRCVFAEIRVEIDRLILSHFSIPKHIIDSAQISYRIPEWAKNHFRLNEHDRATIADHEDDQGKSRRPYPMPEKPPNSP